MILRYYGHSLFTIALEEGLTLATDPYGDFYQYPRRKVAADVVTESHQHSDHNGATMIDGVPRIINQPGRVKLSREASLYTVATFHDGQQGSQRGSNLIFVLEAEGLRIVHCGDLGHVPDESQRLAIGVPDVLLIPVGGYYTIDAKQAAQTVALLRPRVVIPMHYRTRFNPEMPIQTEEPFLKEMGVHPESLPLCRITRQDISERPSVVLMSMPDTPSA